MFRRRPSRSTTLFALAALACAVGAASIVSSYAAHLEALLPATGAPVPIVVATRAIERGATVAADDLQVVELPEAFVPAGALRQPTSAIGERALTAFAPGEVVTPGRIAGGVMGPLAALVPPGLRAVPIVVSAVPTGLVRGDLIDVVSTYGEGRDGRSRARAAGGTRRR